jgi:hypothetical protein
VRQAFDLVAHPVPGESLQRLDNAGMQCPPPLLEKAAIGHLVRQGVPEGEGPLGHHARLIEQVGGLKVHESLLQCVLGELGKGLHERHRHLKTDHRGGLEEGLLLGGQLVDARRQHRVYRLGDRHWGERPTVFHCVPR